MRKLKTIRKSLLKRMKVIQRNRRRSLFQQQERQEVMLLIVKEMIAMTLVDGTIDFVD